ncbi:amidase family protein [Desulfospira joergensenii]|uniref:amidase family protein n=1 Tax=Desulfospira joergensenii TaxID=53329 RepID=UPI0003B4F38A|nr:amidase family protein [Desulfospira joergensenii]
MTHFRQCLQRCAALIFIGAFFCCGKPATHPLPTVAPVYYRSALELAGAIRQGEISASELLDHYLSRIKRYNGAVNAVVAMDVNKARARAAQADKALARGEIWGPLHGLPMTVKEAYEVVGMPATAGDPEFKNHMPKQNAIAVQRLIDAGAIVFGKTNMPFHAKDFQTFNKVYGTTNNPWDLARTPGGSSGGSAAALAMGFTSLELGSDIAGSLRIPAHFTGIYAHKPTFGIIPRFGHLPPLPSRATPHTMPQRPLSVAGPMARSAEDLELAMDILTTSGKSDKDVIRPDLLPAPQKPLQEYRVAVWFTDPYSEAEVDAQVMPVLLKSVNKLLNAGVQVNETARPGIDLRESLLMFLDIYYQKGHLPLAGELVDRQEKMQAKWARFFETYDVLLAPVTPTVAFLHDQTQPKEARELVINGKRRSYMASNFAWTLMAVVAGLPATTAPVGLSDSGLPVGIQIIGARLEDRKTIAFAKELSKLVGGFVAPPAYGE